MTGVFERFELSLNSRGKKKALAVLNQIRQSRRSTMQGMQEQSHNPSNLQTIKQKDEVHKEQSLGTLKDLEKAKLKLQSSEAQCKAQENIPHARYEVQENTQETRCVDQDNTLDGRYDAQDKTQVERQTTQDDEWQVLLQNIAQAQSLKLKANIEKQQQGQPTNVSQPVKHVLQDQIAHPAQQRHYLPLLTIQAHVDSAHKEAGSLYTRSNQFKFINQSQTKVWKLLPCDLQSLLPQQSSLHDYQRLASNLLDAESKDLNTTAGFTGGFGEAISSLDTAQEHFQYFKRCLTSVFFELFRENGEKIGVASALSFVETAQQFIVVNWAISCHYFEIGLEEFVLLYIKRVAHDKDILFMFEDSGENRKAQQFLSQYAQAFSQVKPYVWQLNLTTELQATLQHQTSIQECIKDCN